MLAVAICGGISTFCFTWLSQGHTASSELFKIGVYYDITMAITWTVLPILAFGARLSPIGMLGVLMVVIGGLLIHL